MRFYLKGIVTMTNRIGLNRTMTQPPLTSHSNLPSGNYTADDDAPIGNNEPTSRPAGLRLPSRFATGHHGGQEQFDSENNNGRVMPLEQMLSEFQKKAISEDYRKLESTRGLILETINILFRDYGINNLKFFRRRVDEAKTYEELRVAADMLLSMGMFAQDGGNRD